MSLTDGTHVIYVIEGSVIKESKEWGKPSSKLIKARGVGREWRRSGSWDGTYKRLPNAWASERHQTLVQAGITGFYTYQYAEKFIKNLRKSNQKGEHGYVVNGVLMSNRRHEFRIVRVVRMQTTSVV